ncbi:hypothetical protein [Acidovorax sp.]|uniref:hypothetical protein n=1 Tax=Acidovorax sp. TaxID=1872122 RepID=UPI002ACD4DA7|nr:hypothetical protein [Acidovorax sp.]MDZ7863386.1 hypothetical protein [Acidovorax sp.]
MSDDLTQELKFVADPSGIEAGVERGKRSIKSLGKTAEDVGKEGGDSLGKVGKGAERSAKEIEQATRNMEANLQRQIAKFEATGQSARQYQESLARMRGANLAKLKPLLDQLDAAKAKSDSASRSADGLAKSTNSLGTAASFARGHLAAMAGSITAGAILGFIKSVNDGVDALNDIKDATGSTIENISALEDVGKRTGASFETVGSILVKFNDVLSKATPKSDIANALKAIGLEAEALKKLDPAEALRVTAVALSGYADDANKARLIQDLFGKSVKDAAPFLTDLAEKGELVAKVTTKQAEEAEKFNKELFAMQANAGDAARALTGPLIEGINATAKAFREGRAAGLGFWEIASQRYWNNVREFYGQPQVSTQDVVAGKASDKAAAEAQKLQELQNKLVGVQMAADRDPGNDRAQRRLETLKKQIEDTKKAADAAAIAVINLMNPPVEYVPPEQPKESIKPPKSAAETAAESAAAKKAADERKRELEERQKLLAELSGLSGSFFKEWDTLQKAFKEGAIGAEEMDVKVGQLLAKQPFMVESAKKEAEALKQLTKERQDAADARNADYDAGEKFLQQQRDMASEVVKGIEERVAALDLEDDAAGLAAATNISLAEALLRVRAARLQEKLDGPTGAYEGSEDYLRRKAEIDALNREADGINRVDRNDKARDTTRKAQEDFKRYIEDTQRGLGDAIETAIFDGSKAGGEKMREVLQEALLRKPLRMLIDGVMNQVTGGALQLLGIGGGGGVAGGGGGGGLSNLASLGSSAYQFSQGSGMLYNAYGAASAYMGIGNSAAAAYLSHPLAGIVTNGTVSGVATSTAGTTLGGGGAAGAGAGAGSLAAGGVAALIALAVINILGGMRSESIVGSGFAGVLGGANSLTPWEEWREGGTLLDGSSFSTGNPLEVLKEQQRRLQVERDAGRGETNYAVSLQATVTSLEESTKGLATQTEVFNREVQKGYKAYRSNVVDMANSLGLAGDSVENFAYELGAQDLNLMGLKPEEIQAKIAETFGKAGTEMAEQLLGSWKEVTETIVNTWSDTTDPHNVAYTTETTTSTRMEYQASVYAKAGETAIQTLERLSTSFNTLNEASDALGFGIHQGSLALADFADDFIEAFGGLEKFSSTTSAYMQNYYSDEERRQALLRSGARQANRLGLDNVTAETLEQLGQDGIRAFVTGLTESGASGDQIRDAMDLANFLAPAWASVEAQTPVVQNLTTAVDELTQMYESAIKSLTGERDSLAVEKLRAEGKEKEAEALERQQYLDSFVDEKGQKLDATRLKEIETLYDANRATEKYIQGIKDAAQAQLDALDRLRDRATEAIANDTTATDAAWAAYEAAANKERERQQKTIEDVRAVFEAAQQGARALFGEVDDVAKFQGREARAFIEQAVATAQAGGGLPDAKELAQAIEAINRDFAQTTGSKADADYERLVVANQLQDLEEVGGDQLTIEEAQLKKLDDDLAQGRDMINEMRGVHTGVKDLPGALAALIGAYNKEAQTRANTAAQGTIGKNGAYFDKASGTGKTSTGVLFDASDMAAAAAAAIAANPGVGTSTAIYDALEGKGFTMPQLNDMFGMPPGTLEKEAKALGLPIFHEGTDYVPRTGWALLQEGEAVIPAKHNPFPTGELMGGGRLEGLVSELIARVSAVEFAVDKGNGYAGTTASVLEGAKRGSALAMAPSVFATET